MGDGRLQGENEFQNGKFDILAEVKKQQIRRFFLCFIEAGVPEDGATVRDDTFLAFRGEVESSLRRAVASRGQRRCGSWERFRRPKPRRRAGPAE
jgi:hypothetical protein